MMKPRIDFWLCLSLLTLTAHASAQTNARPNIVLMIADDLAWDDSGPDGNKKVRKTRTK